jgi:hypothetical protein
MAIRGLCCYHNARPTGASSGFGETLHFLVRKQLREMLQSRKAIVTQARAILPDGADLEDGGI